MENSIRKPAKSPSKKKKRPPTELSRKKNGNVSSRGKSPKKTNRNKKSKTKRTWQFIWDLFFYISLGVLVLGAVFYSFNDSPDRSLFGYRFMTVLTNSMAENPENPEYTDGFESGAMIFIKQVDNENLNVGDIITFYPVPGNTDAYLTHRIIEVSKDLDGQEGVFYTTQGDANTGSDVPI